MVDDVGKPRMYVFDDDPERPPCRAEACDRPRWLDSRSLGHFCEEHGSSLYDHHADLVEAFCETSDVRDRMDAVWRCCAALAADEGHEYRRRLFSGEVITVEPVARG